MARMKETKKKEGRQEERKEGKQEERKEKNSTVSARRACHPYSCTLQRIH